MALSSRVGTTLEQSAAVVGREHVSYFWCIMDAASAAAAYTYMTAATDGRRTEKLTDSRTHSQAPWLISTRRSDEER